MTTMYATDMQKNQVYVALFEPKKFCFDSKKFLEGGVSKIEMSYHQTKDKRDGYLVIITAKTSNLAAGCCTNFFMSGLIPMSLPDVEMDDILKEHQLCRN